MRGIQSAQTMAPYEEFRVRKKKPTQEKPMPTSDNLVDQSEPMDEFEAELDTLLAKSEVDVEREAIKTAAAAEERAQAELMRAASAQAKNEEFVPAPPKEQVEWEGGEEPLVSILAKGQDYLHEKMREKMALDKAKEEAHKPPPRTERQLSQLEKELEAGRRAQAKHQAFYDANPPKAHKERGDGETTPVFRPGNVVPDPNVPAASGFAAGNRQFGVTDAKANAQR